MLPRQGAYDCLRGERGASCLSFVVGDPGDFDLLFEAADVDHETIAVSKSDGRADGLAQLAGELVEVGHLDRELGRCSGGVSETMSESWDAEAEQSCSVGRRGHGSTVIPASSDRRGALCSPELTARPARARDGERQSHQSPQARDERTAERAGGRRHVVGGVKPDSLAVRVQQRAAD